MGAGRSNKHRLKGDGLEGSAESRPGYGPNSPKKEELKAHRLKAVGLDLEMEAKREILANGDFSSKNRSSD